jgi:hypothetical protein
MAATTETLVRDLVAAVGVAVARRAGAPLAQQLSLRTRHVTELRRHGFAVGEPVPSACTPPAPQ